MEGNIFLFADDTVELSTQALYSTLTETPPFISLPSYTGLLALEHLLSLECVQLVLEKQGLQQRTSNQSPNNNTARHAIHRRPHYSATCRSYNMKIYSDREVIPKFYGQCVSHFDEGDITLILQMDIQEDLFSKLSNTTRIWDGPISVALYANKWLEDASGYKRIVKAFFRKYKLQDTYVCIHLVREVSFSAFLFFKYFDSY